MRGMKLLLKSFIVWLMLLAIPFQGYASATMMLCASAAHAGHAAQVESALSGPAPAHFGHDHAAHNHLAMSADTPHHHAGTAHDGAKCGMAGACCCAGALPMATFAVHLPALGSTSEAIPFHPDFLPAVDLAHPERPPQSARA